MNHNKTATNSSIISFPNTKKEDQKKQKSNSKLHLEEGPPAVVNHYIYVEGLLSGLASLEQTTAALCITNTADQFHLPHISLLFVTKCNGLKQHLKDMTHTCCINHHYDFLCVIHMPASDQIKTKQQTS